MSPSYPPEPWTLQACMDLSTFLVPRTELPTSSWPVGYRPVVVGGRIPVGAAWVIYEPGGVLDYQELLVSVLVRRGARILPHVIAIWVDSAASCAGGRELWGIPKGMATFAGDPARPSCIPEGAAAPVARAEVSTGSLLPARLPIGFSIVQHWPLPAGDEAERSSTQQAGDEAERSSTQQAGDEAERSSTQQAGDEAERSSTHHNGRPRVSPVRTRSRVGTASVRWSFDPDGPLGFLAGRRPVVSTALRDVAMLFGMTPTDRDRQEPSVDRHV